MNIKTKILFVVAVISFILPCVTQGEMGGRAWGLPIDYRDIDPLDTLDEEDLAAMRDTSMLTRRNLAKETDHVNALDYILKDRYTPKHHSFDHKWYDHMFIGAGLGVEKIVPQQSSFQFRTLTNVDIMAGKQLDKYNTIRLSLGAGWGYQQDQNFWMKRAQLKFDYLYNLSTFFAGYNPARRIEASLLFGVGANYSWLTTTEKRFAPEGHFGVQLKCYTGPLGTINIEPYLGISSDQIDLSKNRNWRRYDLFYGVNLNYSFYLVDNLSKEARLQLLQSRMADDRMVDPNTIEKWRTPWFVEYSMGPVMSKSPYLDFSKTMGNQTSISVGRWLSPVMGFRLSAISRSTKYSSTEIAATKKTAGYTSNYNSNYLSGRIEALVNPIGFFKSFKWDAPMGAYLTFGVEMGSMSKYVPSSIKPKNLVKVVSNSYDIGAHLWYAISEDLQAFVEPRFMRNEYAMPYSNVNMFRLSGENSFGIDIGLTMLIRSEKYHNLYEMDHTQNYTYRHIRGVRIGVAGGLPVYQRSFEYLNSDKMSWNAMAFVEYRFNELHTVRAQAELLNASNGAIIEYKDAYTDTHGDKQKLTRNGIWNFDRKMLLASLNYEVSLTNLCSGRLRDRLFELEVFAGPAIGYLLDSKQSISPLEPMAAGSDHVLTPMHTDEKKLLFGADLGLKLSTHIWKGISVFLTPTTYFLYNKKPLPGLNTMNIDQFRLLQTINLGIQYKVGKLRRNPEVVRRIHRIRDHEWKNRQIELQHKYAEKLAEKQAKRKAKYFNR